jgi:chromosome segregation ATPase
MSIEITGQQMYDLLTQIDRKVTAMAQAMESHDRQLADHEGRLRSIEAEEDTTSRLERMEHDMRDLLEQVRGLQRKVWAIPSATAVIAAAAVVLTLVRTY